MNKFLVFTGMAAAAVLLTGCFCNTQDYVPTEIENVPEITVRQSSGAINIDGKLDEKAWQQAAVYDLVYYDNSLDQPKREHLRVNADKFEGGKVRMLYDKDYIYIAGEFADKDIIGYATANQTRLHNQGDIMEIHLCPADAVRFWEIQLAPNDLCAAFFYITGDMWSITELSGVTALPQGMKSAAVVNGKLNDHKKADKSWSVEVRIPRKMFAEAGSPFAPGKPWLVRLGRRNVSHNLYTLQRGYYPAQPFNRFLQRQYFAPVVFK